MREYTKIGRILHDEQSFGKVTGQLQYCGDFQSAGMLHVRLKGSEVTHGIVRAIHTEKAQKAPGVRAVYTWENTPDTPYDRGKVEPWETAPYQERLFNRHIRFYGERVAAVVADTEEAAKRACDLIQVEYDPLPAAVTVEEAMRPDAPKLFPEGNVWPVESFDYGDYQSVTGDIVTRTRSHIGRMTHLTMETQSCRARYTAYNGKLTVWSACQTVFGVRSTVANFLGMNFSKVRVIKPPMGGSFGVRQETLLEPLTAYIAKELNADVKLVYTREEQIVNTMMKHSLDAEIESKVNRDGRIVGVSVFCRLDAGGYLTSTGWYAASIGEKLGKVYRMQAIHFGAEAVCTNTPVNGSFRSWGSSEEAYILESHLNVVAGKLNMDPIEFRLKNVLKPYDTDVCHRVSIGNAHFTEALTKGREVFRWEEKKQECRRKNAEQKRYRYGIGMAAASHTSSFFPRRMDIATAAARLQEDGSLIVHIGIHDHGCGTVLAMKKIAAEVMEIDMDKIELQEADTQNCLYDFGCYSSRTVYTLGRALKECCEHMIDLCRQTAAASFGCGAAFLRYRDGCFYRETEPEKKMTLAEIVRYAITVQGKDIYYAGTVNANADPGVPAIHFSEVRVDTYTGMTEVLNCLSVHDIGKAINPDMCRGQVGSGIQQGMGIALCEEIKIHPKTGRTLITNLKGYENANSCDIPDYKTVFIEEADENGPFGAKSIGEAALVSVAPAIAAAVNDALDTQLLHLPLTPAVILEALEEKKR